MAYRTKTSQPCSDCGSMTRRRLRGKRIPCCTECGVKRMLDAARQQHAREGTAYANWSAAMHRWAATLPSPPDE